MPTTSLSPKPGGSRHRIKPEYHVHLDVSIKSLTHSGQPSRPHTAEKQRAQMTVMEFRHRVDKFDIALRHRLAPADKVRVIGKPGSNVAITVECGLSQSRCIKGYSPYYDRSIRLSRGRYAPDFGLFKAVYLWKGLGRLAPRPDRKDHHSDNGRA